MGKSKDETKSMKLEKARETLKKEKEKGSRLINITGDERNGEYFLVYHLDQGEGKKLNLEAKLDDKKAERATDIYENADLYERECREMYGIEFGEEMKNLFLPEGIQEPSKEELEEGMKEMEKGEEHA